MTERTLPTPDEMDVADLAHDAGYESLGDLQYAVRQINRLSASSDGGATVVHLSQVLTPLGPMLLGAADQGVCLLEFTDRRMVEAQLRRLAERLNLVYVPGSNEHGAQLERELEAYFAGTLREFQTPLQTPGSEFQQRAWSALRTIPYGETRSYADQARLIGAPAAVRAVARANGDNRIAIVIPCHRVIGADGSLTGYGGGLRRKQWLLKHEQARFRDDSLQAELAL